MRNIYQTRFPPLPERILEMLCVKCNKDTKVTNSRNMNSACKSAPKENTVKRKRVCLTCGHQFWTREILWTDLIKEPQAVSSPKQKPEAPSLKKSNIHRLRPKKRDIVRDVDKMTDAELEALIYNEGGFDYDED